MNPDDDAKEVDEWTVVGRNNRPKRPAQPATAAKPLRATAPVPPPAAAADAAASTLPGWGRAGHKRPSPAAAAATGPTSDHKRLQHQRPGRRRERDEAARRIAGGGGGSGSDDDDNHSRERRCALHAGLVREAASEVSRSAMFQSLRAAMKSAGAGQEEEEEDDDDDDEQQQRVGGGNSGFPWQSVSELVVYGLGSVESSRVSRHQAALATLLAAPELLPRVAERVRQQQQVVAAEAAAGAQEQDDAAMTTPTEAPRDDNGGVVAYDPCFSRVDRRVLRALGWGLITKDERCGRRAALPAALFYLPHLEAPLTDALLAANWTRARLRRLAILGNAFSRYAERWPLARVEAAEAAAAGGGGGEHGPPRRLLALVAAGTVEERRVREGEYGVASAFNDAALHTFCGATDAQFEAAGVPEEEEG